MFRSREDLPQRIPTRDLPEQLRYPISWERGGQTMERKCLLRVSVMRRRRRSQEFGDKRVFMWEKDRAELYPMSYQVNESVPF